MRVAPERDLVYSRGPREVVVQIDLDGRRADQTRRAPMNLAIVLDRSGSMEGAKLEKARQAAAMASATTESNHGSSLSQVAAPSAA